MYWMLFLKKSVSLLWGTLVANAGIRLAGVNCTGIIRCFGVPAIEKRPGGRISIGRGAVLKSSQISSFMGLNHPCKFSTLEAGAEIAIGDGFQASACVISARKSIRIGNRVMLGANVTILDNDCHSLDVALRQIKDADINSAPVVIEDDVFIGMNSIILKGVTIGRGSIVAAGSVVVKSVAPHSVVGGNPARELKVG